MLLGKGFVDKTKLVGSRSNQMNLGFSQETKIVKLKLLYVSHKQREIYNFLADQAISSADSVLYAIAEPNTFAKQEPQKSLSHTLAHSGNISTTVQSEEKMFMSLKAPTITREEHRHSASSSSFDKFSKTSPLIASIQGLLVIASQ